MFAWIGRTGRLGLRGRFGLTPAWLTFYPRKVKRRGREVHLVERQHQGMGDARHKRKYPKGTREQMTRRWKDRVLERLAENKRNDVYPRNQVELAEAVGAAEKSAITKMLKATSSKLVPEVCRVLQIPMPMQERREPDALDELLEDKTAEQRARIAELIRIAGL